MGNTCTKPIEDEDIFEGVIVEEVIDIHPNEFNSEYSIKWNDKKKVFIYKQSNL